MSYYVDLSDRASDEIALYKKSSPRDYKKVQKIIKELEEHPRTGTGHPEHMKGDETQWSRHITKKDRIKYEINDQEVYVYVISAKDHYDDH